MERHGAGDGEAFGEVVRRHRDRLWAVALRTLGDREEAADALQDALVSALRATRRSPEGGGGAFRGEAAVTTWLHRIVVNACIDRARRRAARPADPLPDREHPLPHTRDAISAKETALVVSDALATLAVDQRAALVLVDMHGFSVEEAARILEVPVGTIKSRCARGRARLLPLLEGLGGGPRHARSEPADHPQADHPRADQGGIADQRNPDQRNPQRPATVPSSSQAEPPAQRSPQPLPIEGGEPG